MVKTLEDIVEIKGRRTKIRELKTLKEKTALALERKMALAEFENVLPIILEREGLLEIIKAVFPIFEDLEKTISKRSKNILRQRYESVEKYWDQKKKSFYASLAGVTLKKKDYEELNKTRPRIRADCLEMDRPCPYVGCKYHLMLDVTPSGEIKVYFPDFESMPYSCALDVATSAKDRTLEEVGQMYNCTKEMIRKIQLKALKKLQESKNQDLMQQ
jgi:hypothetical protein